MSDEPIQRTGGPNPPEDQPAPQEPTRSAEAAPAPQAPRLDAGSTDAFEPPVLPPEPMPPGATIQRQLVEAAEPKDEVTEAPAAELTVSPLEAMARTVANRTQRTQLTLS